MTAVRRASGIRDTTPRKRTTPVVRVSDGPCAPHGLPLCGVCNAERKRAPEWRRDGARPRKDRHVPFGPTADTSATARAALDAADGIDPYAHPVDRAAQRRNRDAEQARDAARYARGIVGDALLAAVRSPDGRGRAR